MSLKSTQAKDILHRALMRNFDRAGRQSRVSMKQAHVLTKSETISRMVDVIELPSAWNLKREAGPGATEAVDQVATAEADREYS